MHPPGPMPLEVADVVRPVTEVAIRRRAPLVAMVISAALTMIGSRFTSLSIPWLVLTTTGSPTRMGVVAAVAAVAYILASLWRADFVERIGVRRVGIATQLLTMAALVAVVTLYRAGFWVLLVGMAVSSAASAVGTRAKRILVQPVADAAGTPIVRVTAIYDGINRTATLVGAPAAGVLIALAGPLAVIWIDVGSLLVATVLLAALVRVPDTAPAAGPAAGPAAAPAAVDDGSLRANLGFLRRDRVISGLVSILFMTNLFNQAASAVLLPLWAHEVADSPVALGLVSGALGGGAILGNVVFAVIATRLRRYPTLALGYLVGGAPRFLVLAVSDDLAVVLAVTFVSGFAISTVNPIYGALLYERIPRRLQSRMFGLTNAITVGGTPVGGLFGAWAVAGAGLTGALVLTGLAYFAVTMLPLARRHRWRGMDDKPTPATLAATG